MRPSTSSRPPGRPRDAGVDEAVIDAAVEALATCGFGACTVEAVAAGAGVSKASVYRRWPSRDALLLDVCHRLAELHIRTVPDTGNLRDDLVALVTSLVESLRSTPSGRLVHHMVGEAACNPELRSAFDNFVATRRRAPLAIMERAAARGELRPGLDLELAVDLVAGPIFNRLLLTGARLDASVAEAVVDSVLEGIAAR